MRIERRWLIVAIGLTVLLLIAIGFTLAVIRPPAMEPVPLPSASWL